MPGVSLMTTWKRLPYPLIAANKLARDLGIIDAKENICYRAFHRGSGRGHSMGERQQHERRPKRT
ncbi:MAG: hypothetical protein U1D30_00550 [Planctomycetota bacterium]